MYNTIQYNTIQFWHHEVPGFRFHHHSSPFPFCPISPPPSTSLPATYHCDTLPTPPTACNTTFSHLRPLQPHFLPSTFLTPPDLATPSNLLSIKQWGRSGGGGTFLYSNSKGTRNGLCVDFYAFPSLMYPFFWPPMPHFLTHLAVLKLQNDVIDE